MSLKITTLIENMQDEKGQLACEHGFSVYIEINGKRILFDTGQTGAFVKNAEALGIDLSETDMVVLSHGHYDHTGGVPELLGKLKRKTPFYIGKEFFVKKYKLQENGSLRYNGNPFPEELLTQSSQAECHFIEKEVTEISENLFLFKNFARVTEYEGVNPKFLIETEAGMESDLFADEIALGILTEQGLVLIVGCSHAGIGNILHHVEDRMNFPVAAVVGGTHLVEADEERLSKTAEVFLTCGIKRIAVSHCTGETGMDVLKKQFGEKFMINNTGNRIIFE